MTESYLFLAGRLSLDFAQPDGATPLASNPVSTPGNLADWLASSPLELVVAEISTDELAAARALRSAIGEAATRAIRQRPLPRSAVDVINRNARRPDLVMQLENGLTVWRARPSVYEALSTLARDAISLLGSAERNRIRRCKGSDCGLLFVDHSRPGRRVWCSMSRCGNLAKTSGYRLRLKGK